VIATLGIEVLHVNHIDSINCTEHGSKAMPL
jgi:hypothetical protein